MLIPCTEETEKVFVGPSAKAKNLCLLQKRKRKPIYNNEIEKDIAFLGYQKDDSSKRFVAKN